MLKLMFRITQICFIAIMQTKPAFGDLNNVKEHVNLSWYVIVEAVWPTGYSTGLGKLSQEVGPSIGQLLFINV